MSERPQAMGKDKAKETPEAKADKYSAPALSKGLDILELLANQTTGMKKAEIAQALDRSVNEIYRMLAVLVSRGYVMIDEESERYSLTMRMFEISHRFPPTKRLTTVAGKIMEETARKLNQSIHLAVRNGGEILIIAQLDSPGNNITAVRLGARVPLIMTSSGACLAYNLPQDELAELLDQQEKPVPGALEAFEKAIEQVRQFGVCEHPSLIIEGVRNLSVPIIGYDGEPVAALTIPHVKRLYSRGDPGIEDCKQTLVEAGRRISEKIGAGAAAEASANSRQE